MAVGCSLGVDRLIFGTIRKQPQATMYTVSLKQLNVLDSTIENTSPKRCRPRPRAPTARSSTTWSAAGCRPCSMISSRGGFRIPHRAGWASVLLDGAAGPSPLAFNEVEIGDHMVRIELPGFPGNPQDHGAGRPERSNSP